MARLVLTQRSSDWIMINSGRVAHISPQERKVTYLQGCDAEICLNNDAKIRAYMQSTRRFQWIGDDEPVNVQLPNTLYAPDVNISML